MIEGFKAKFTKRTIIIMILLVIIALLSLFVISNFVTAPEFNASTVKSLDDKKVTVVRLTAIAAATSTALSLLPGDIAMPIADQIAELSSYFIVILGAILLEKILISIVGYVSFTFIIPIACLLGIIYLFKNIEVVRTLAIKLAIFGIVIFIAIPISTGASDLIDESFHASLNDTIASAEENKEFIEEKKEELSKEDSNWLEKIGQSISNLTSKIGSGINDMIKKGEETLSKFLDAIAVLIITTCVIPIVVILLFIWIIKILFGFSVQLPTKHIPLTPKHNHFPGSGQ